jgi:prepilin-type processing-associated H-X9-DG protein
MLSHFSSSTAYPSIARFALQLRSLSRIAFAGTLLASALFAGIAAAQEGQVIRQGSMAVTGFSKTVIPGIEEGLPPGVDAIDETMIDLEGKTLRIFDVSNLGGPASGQLVNLPLPFEVPARQIGQVFGLSYDDGIRTDTTDIVPNLYATATSLHGIQIVTPDEDADGRPERQHSGAANAAFMDGQFGLDLGGGPGSIYKIDGLTGVVTKFADIETNSGPGLGNIKFDKSHRQFFVSDVDTGLIHRISIDGALIDTFDHGVAGRPGHGLGAVADDGSVMDIKGGAFDSEDPETWGFTQDERRVWGVAVHGGRLYYAVGDAAEIWSVGIARDGTFEAAARWELTVKTEKDYPVTDIAFDSRGFMYLSQRGEIENRYDYSRFANSGKGEVIRYWRESPDDPATESIWVETPQDYAVGFAPENRQAAGGLDLQYGYDQYGLMDFNACTETIVKTGDDLRHNDELADQLGLGGPLVVHGVQLTDLDLVKPANVPPFGSWFVDFDSLFEDPDVKGHVGDVEIWHPCAGRAGYYEPLPYPGTYPDPYWPPYYPPTKEPPCIDISDAQYFCTPAGLEVDLYVDDVTGLGGDSLKSDSLSPGISVSPPMQTRPNAAAPFTLGLSGTVPGDKVKLGLCFYKDADAGKGGYFPCCKVNVDIETPLASCAP